MPKRSYLTVTDQFCGAGGSSLGATAAGAVVETALNHWDLAIKTHATNFPQVEHDCTDISACNPRRYRRTDILITSPECTNHSLAKGKKRQTGQASLFDEAAPDPAAERSRATMWDVPRFAEYHNYEAIIVENVVDARNWVMWPAWIQAMDLLGYDYQCLYLNSMHFHPTPQSRDRMYVVFWKRANRRPDLDYHPLAWCSKCERDIHAVQSWKRSDKRFGKYKQQYVYRCGACTERVEPYYYCAYNAIDWSIDAPRIGDRKIPLKEKTLARIRYGLERFRGDFLTSPNHDTLRAYSVADPHPTQTAGWRYGLVQSPVIIPSGYTHEHHDRRAYSTLHALPTQSTRAELGIAVPPFMVELRAHSTARTLEEPLATFCAGGQHHALCVPSFLTSYYGNNHGGTPLDDPVGTITTRDRHALVVPPPPFLVSYYGGRHAVQGLEHPMPTQPTMALHYLAEPGNIPEVDDCGFRMLQPHEVGAAMGFPDDYIVLGDKRQKIKQYGNAVTPEVMTWIFGQVAQTLS